MAKIKITILRSEEFELDWPDDELEGLTPDDIAFNINNDAMNPVKTFSEIQSVHEITIDGVEFNG